MSRFSLVVASIGLAVCAFAAELKSVSVERGVPSDAEVLFDGSDVSKWRNREGGPASWRIQSDGVWLVDKTGNTPTSVVASVYTRDVYTNFQLHVEYRIPADIGGGDQWRGNSGVKMFGCYEVQILDNYENPTPALQACGALYQRSAPLVNACQKPGTWQALDIVFHAPRIENGVIRDQARATVLHNGVLVQDNAAWWPYPDKAENKAKACGTIELQSHNDHSKCISYRNIWVRRL